MCSPHGGCHTAQQLGNETSIALGLPSCAASAWRYAHQRDLLASAIFDAARQAGIINGAVPLDGPQLLMVLDDLVAASCDQPRRSRSSRPPTPTCRV